MNNQEELMEQLMLDAANEAMVSAMIWTYSIVGGLFMFYSFVVFIQCRIKKELRFSLSFSFFLTGLLFFNLAGRAITGYVYQFTLLTIINSIVLAIAVGVCVYFLININRLKL